MNRLSGDSSREPVLSVIVTVVAGVDAVASLLDALASQIDPPSMEVIVPFDVSAPEIAGLAPRYGGVHFLDLGVVPTGYPATTAAGQHELYDRRRSAALAVARGDLIAIVEDGGLPRPDWARTAARLHQQPWAVVGGAVEPVQSTSLGWALYLCDYSRYGLPFRSGEARWLSDVNVVYKRRAIESTRAVWQERFHEPLVHWDLMRRGEVLYLAADLVVDHQRRHGRLASTLEERFRWGRLFGHIRSRELGALQRLALILAAPLVPWVVFARILRAQAARGRVTLCLRVMPMLLLVLGARSAGEAVGCATGRP
jgi:hypothetical protein